MTPYYHLRNLAALSVSGVSACTASIIQYDNRQIRVVRLMTKHKTNLY